MVCIYFSCVQNSVALPTDTPDKSIKIAKGISTYYLSPDNRTFATFKHDRARKLVIDIWSIPDEKIIHTVELESGSIGSAAFSADSKTLIVKIEGGFNKTTKKYKFLVLISTETGEILRTTEGEYQKYGEIIRSNDGRYYTSFKKDVYQFNSMEAEIPIWSKNFDKPIYTIKEPTWSPTGMAFSQAENALIILGRTQRKSEKKEFKCTYSVVKFFSLSTFTFYRTMICRGSTDFIAVSDTEKVIILSNHDGKLQLMSLKTGELIKTIQKGTGPVQWEPGFNSKVMRPDGQILAISNGEIIKLRSVKDGDRIGQINPENGAGKLSFTPDGKYLISLIYLDSENIQMLEFWDMNRLYPIPAVSVDMRYTPSEIPPEYLEWNPDKDNAIKTYYWGKKFYDSYKPSISNTKNLLALNENKVISLINGKTICELSDEKLTYGIHKFEFSPDEKYIATAKEYDVFLWSLYSGSLIRKLKVEKPHIMRETTHEDYVYALAFNHDGTVLASGDGRGNILLWSIPSCKYSENPGNYYHHAHSRGVNGLAFSPDGKMLASNGFEEEIKLWSVKTGELLFKFKGFG